MKRTLSKKSISQHKQKDMKDQLKHIQKISLANENMFDKLLRPIHNEKSQPNQLKKYNPKFQKRDYETLVHENYILKKQMKIDRQSTISMKLTINDFQRKIRFLQTMQQKYERMVNQQQITMGRQSSSVYTEILKKKIQQLNQNNIKAEEKIKDLKRLPHVTVFDESQAQKLQFINQTIRLKAIITSLAQSQEKNEDILDNKVLKMMKQQNQKLKSSVRILENDKNLLKTRQNIQKRQITDYRKEIDSLASKVINKEAQIQKLNSQNKNLLFKRVNQLKIEQESRQNEEISRLKLCLDQQHYQFRQLQNEKQHINNEYQKMKKKQQEYLEAKQQTQEYQKKLIKSQLQKFKKQNEELIQELEKERQNFRILECESKKKKIQKYKSSKNNNKNKVEFNPPVKYEHIQFSILSLIHNKNFNDISQLFDQEEIKCSKLSDIFTEEPVNLERQQALKLARYITETNDGNKKIEYNPNVTVTKQFCLLTIKAAINKYRQCQTVENQVIWRCVLSKTKKLFVELETMRGQFISKEAFLNLLGKFIKQHFSEYINMMVLLCYDVQNSQNQIMLSVDMIITVFNKIIDAKPIF